MPNFIPVTQPTAEADSIAGSLLDRFRHGALPYTPKTILFGSHNPVMSCGQALSEAGKCDPKMSRIHLDHKRMKEWLMCASETFDVDVEGMTDQEAIEDAFESCHTAPTFLYMNGHGDMEGRTYCPAECSSPNCFYGTLDIPLATMRKRLVGKVEPMRLVVVTDFCYCPNFLELPYVAKKKDGIWYWLETGMGSEPGRWNNKHILHYASTSPGKSAYEFQSTGGIYTREFYNVSPRSGVTLGERLDKIQAGMVAFFDRYALLPHGEPLEQYHQVYSSHKLSFSDTDVFKTMGLYS